MDVIETLGIIFPDKLSGLLLGPSTNHELTHPGLGCSIPYDYHEHKATVYLYDYGLTNIPDDANAQLVEDHFLTAVGDIQKLATLGQYQKFKLKKSYKLEFPHIGVNFLCADLFVIQDNQKLDTFIFISTLKGHFVKLRYTTPKNKQSQKKCIRFLNALAELLWHGPQPTIH